MGQTERARKGMRKIRIVFSIDVTLLKDVKTILLFRLGRVPRIELPPIVL
jgi:hypothetical protein